MRLPFIEIRDIIHEQIQDPPANGSRQGRTTADHLSDQQNSQSRQLESETQIQNKEQLNEDLEVSRRAETILKICVSRLEERNQEIQFSLQEYQNLKRKSDLSIGELQNQLAETKNEALIANNSAESQARQYLGLERGFSRYRADTVAYLANWKPRIQVMTDGAQASKQECLFLRQQMADIGRELESFRSDCSRLAAEILRYHAAAEELRHEQQNAIDQAEEAQDRLRVTEEQRLEIEVERDQLSADYEDVSRNLRTSTNAAQQLAAENVQIQRQLAEYKEAQRVCDEHLQQTQQDASLRLEQTQKSCSMEIERVESSLHLSEEARKECQAKLRLVEVSAERQLDQHKHNTKEAFSRLITESRQIYAQLKARHFEEMIACREEVEDKFRKQLLAAGPPAEKILVSNTQPTDEPTQANSQSQQHQAAKERKKVDRQDPYTMITIPSTSQQVDSGYQPTNNNTYESEPAQGEIGSSYFEEFERINGTQTSPQDQETQCSVLEVGGEVVSETQDFECPRTFSEAVPETQEYQCAQQVNTQSIIAASRLSADCNLQQDGSQRAASSTSSDDLSSMLFDPPKSSKHGGHTSSTTHAVAIPDQLTHHLTSDTPSPQSQVRPRSRANTASRMMRLSHHDASVQRFKVSKVSEDSMNSSSRLGDELADKIPALAQTIGASSKNSSTTGTSHQDDASTTRKRRSTSNTNEVNSPKKVQRSTQSHVRRQSPKTKSFAPCTPAPATTRSANRINDNTTSPSVANRRTSNRQSSLSSSQGSANRLSSARNTRSKSKSRL